MDVAAAFDPQQVFDLPDPYPLFAELRRTQPVAPLVVAGRTLHVVTTWDAATRVLHDQATFDAPALVGVVLGRPRKARAQVHFRTRALAAASLGGPALEALEPVVARLVDACLDPFLRERRADLIAGFARPLPIQVLAHVIGMPPADYPRLLAWAHDLLVAAKDPARGARAAQALGEHLAPLLAARRAEPRDDLVSRLIAGQVGGQGLSEAEVLAFLQTLLPAGADPPMQLLGSLMVALLQDRERFERVRADRTLVPWAVEETLRWETPITFVMRQATAAARVADLDVPLGARLCVVIGAANRDEAHYPDPDRFDMDRRPTDHLSFSFGRHYCMGSNLARLVVTRALAGLLDRAPRLRLDPDSPPPAITGFAFRAPERVPVLTD